jgi:ABC-type branched-subunit amino acid transport system permease subunit
MSSGLLPLRRLRNRVRAMVLLAAIAWPFLVDSPVAHRRGAEIVALVLAGVALTVTVGWLRVLAFHVPLGLAVGAATTTVLLGRGQSLPLALVAALVTGGVAGAVVVLPALRRPGFLVPLVTITAVLAVWGVILPSVRLTGFARPVVVGVDLGGDRALYLTALALAAAAWFAVANLHASPMGRRARATASAPDLARMSGADPTATWIGAFALSGALAAGGGAVLALIAQGMPQPALLSPTYAVALMAIPLLGGREPEGAVVGALVLGLVPIVLPGVVGADVMIAALLVAIVACTPFPGVVDGLLARLGRAA